MARQAQPGRGGGRNSGRGGRGKYPYHKKGDKKDSKKSSNDRKHMFTLVANTKDVRVSTHTPTLKKPISVSLWKFHISSQKMIRKKRQQ